MTSPDNLYPGSSPLHYAASRGHLNITKTLIEHGADVYLENRKHYTPLHMTALENCEMAKKKEKIDVARFLLNSGAKVNAMNSEHKTPLHIAANCDNLEIAELLLQFDADPNAGKISGVIIHIIY